MSVHAFVDETKSNGLLVVAAVLAPRDLAPARTMMRGLCLPGQSRLHFTKERPGRRGEITAAICRMCVALDIYDATSIHDQRQARAGCLRQIVVDLAAAHAQRLVIEQDDSLLKHDQAVLYAAVQRAGVADSLTYEHLPARSEPCCGSLMPPRGAGPMVQPGRSGSLRWCATSSRSRQREARLTHRPEGCRAHFRALLHPAVTG